MKLGNVATIKTNYQNADFWLIRRGSINAVGLPVEEYSPEHIGVKINSDLLMPKFLYYWFQNFHNTGHWKSVATGTTDLVNTRTADVKNIPIGRQ